MTPVFVTPAWGRDVAWCALPGVLLVRVGAFPHDPAPVRPAAKPRPVFSVVKPGAAES